MTDFILILILLTLLGYGTGINKWIVRPILWIADKIIAAFILAILFGIGMALIIHLMGIA